MNFKNFRCPTCGGPAHTVETEEADGEVRTHVRCFCNFEAEYRGRNVRVEYPCERYLPEPWDTGYCPDADSAYENDRFEDEE